MPPLNQLIQKADILEFWPLSLNIDDARINPWIQRAQNSRLQSVLGPALYYALATATIVPGDRFDKLMVGDDYQYDTNFEQRFPGVRELLCAYSYAFLVDNNAVHVTRGGVNRKAAVDVSENVAAQTTSLKSQDAYSEAIRLEGEFFKYMSKKQDVYPEYDSSAPSQRSSQMFWNASRARRSPIARYGLDDYYENNPNG